MEDTSDLHSRAWVQLAEDEGKSRPLQFALKRAEGMKNDQVCSSAYIAGSENALSHSACIADSENTLSHSAVQCHTLCSSHAISLTDPLL